MQPMFMTASEHIHCDSFFFCLLNKHIILQVYNILVLCFRWADQSNGTGNAAYGAAYGKPRQFDHPFLQVCITV